MYPSKLQYRTYSELPSTSFSVPKEYKPNPPYFDACALTLPTKSEDAVNSTLSNVTTLNLLLTESGQKRIEDCTASTSVTAMSQCCGRASANTTTEDRITVWLTRIRTPDDSADSAPPTNCSAAPSRNVHPMSVMLMGRCSGILSKENVSAAPTPLNVTPKKQCCVFHMFSVIFVSVWFTTQLVSPSTALSGTGGTTVSGTSKGRHDAPCHPSLQLHKHKLRSTDSVPGM
ncbi:hypothetical protein ECC02_010883 [Trypanosoma cruzi]|uniref:Uncharacterized protein n=1 Tax=Trypanosoma cruzi TaxID=5693 RepID=A0A7J6XPE7_TRYCR|nr:hypothetical protein ECC02_010883 [Trypanosoma cruzi]